ncbi:MAG: hypothetical protein U5N26_01145 [Candidatus Marinimicrobia bacterium]|nr:hypothetical protein [Candidatus Neomarinimicrobiota bacterium]
MFDDFLKTRDARPSPFSETDYDRYVDGTESFLRSRGISLPYGNPSDPPEKESKKGTKSNKVKYVLIVTLSIRCFFHPMLFVVYIEWTPAVFSAFSGTAF